MPVAEGSPGPRQAQLRPAPIGTLVVYGFLFLVFFVAAIVGHGVDLGPFPSGLSDLIRYGLIALIGGSLGGVGGGVGMGWFSTGRVRGGMLLSAVLAGALGGGLIAFLLAWPQGRICAGPAAAWGGVMSAVIYAARRG